MSAPERTDDGGLLDSLDDLILLVDANAYARGWWRGFAVCLMSVVVGVAAANVALWWVSW